MPSAGVRIYPFPSRPAASNWLTMRDRLDLHAFQDRIVEAGFQLVVVRDGTGDASHDFVQLVRPAGSVVAWTLVRCGPCVTAWHNVHGPDFGRFPGMDSALDAALAVVPGRSPDCRRHCARPPGRQPAVAPIPLPIAACPPRAFGVPGTAARAGH